MGQQPEKAVRSCLLATGLGRALGLSEEDVRDVYFASLLRHLGCTALTLGTGRGSGSRRPSLVGRGYQLRYGLFYTDYPTGGLIPKASAERYRARIAQERNGAKRPHAAVIPGGEEGADERHEQR